MASYDEWVAALEHAYEPTTGHPTSRAGVHVALSVAMIEGGLRTSGRLSWASRKIYEHLAAWGWTRDTWEDWSEAASGSNNLGAVQYRRPQEFGEPPWPAVSPDGRGFLYYDTSPQPDGTSVPYPMYFRRYTVDDAASGFLRTLYVIHGRDAVRRAAEAGQLGEVSRLLRETRYYEGFGATQAERIARHHQGLSSAAVTVARHLGWPLPSGEPLPPPTLRRGATGPEVEQLQEVLGVEPDGIFGAGTEAAVRRHQRAAGLEVDGIVGPATWGSLTDQPPDTEPAPTSEPTVDTRLEAAVLTLQRAMGLMGDAIGTLTEPRS